MSPFKHIEDLSSLSWVPQPLNLSGVLRSLSWGHPVSLWWGPQSSSVERQPAGPPPGYPASSSEPRETLLSLGPILFAEFLWGPQAPF